MCIIVAVPAGQKIPRWELKNCWNNNQDGAGLMYVYDGRIVVAKEFSNPQKFFKLYDKHLERAIRAGSPMVLHFRVGTHGKKSILNVHPFRINDSVWFCHNGVLKAPESNVLSDTQMYNNRFLKSLPEKFYKKPAILELLEGHIGSSKFVFLTVEKNIIILNRQLGETDQHTKVWYSNRSFSAYHRGSRTGGTYSEKDFETIPEEDLERWLGRVQQSFPSSQLPVVQRLLPTDAQCTKCQNRLPLEKLKAVSDTSDSLLCDGCMEEVSKEKSKYCMYCQKEIDLDDDITIFEDGAAFCSRCMENLTGMEVAI